jgi:DNA polymerase-1
MDLAIPESEVTPEIRKRYKRYALGLNYGMGIRKFAKMQGCTEQQAKRLSQSYLNVFHCMKVYRDWVVEKARVDHVLRNPFGRLRWFVDDTMSPEALNFNPQTIVTGMLLRSVVGMERDLVSTGLKARGWRQAVWIHDAMALTGPLDGLLEAESVMKRHMEREWSPWMPGFQVPADAKVGRCLRPLGKSAVGELKMGKVEAWDQRDLIPLDLFLKYDPDGQRLDLRRVA